MRLVIREYLTEDGSNPYREWLMKLDTKTRARVQARVLRFEEGNLGDHKALQAGVWEARLAFGPGYRIYFGREGEALVLLLCGGDKSTQRRDIEVAKGYWKKYTKEPEDGKAQR